MGFGSTSSSIGNFGGIVVYLPATSGNITLSGNTSAEYIGIGHFDFDLAIVPDVVVIEEGARLMIGGTGYAITAGNTVYVGTTASATEANVKVSIPALSIVELKATSSVAPGAGDSFTLTLRKNGIDTALVSTISNTDYKNGVTGSIAYLDGDDLSLSVVSSATAATATISFSIKTEFAS
jgi:hypothetical protein